MFFVIETPTNVSNSSFSRRYQAKDTFGMWERHSPLVPWTLRSCPPPCALCRIAYVWTSRRFDVQRHRQLVGQERSLSHVTWRSLYFGMLGLIGGQLVLTCHVTVSIVKNGLFRGREIRVLSVLCKWNHSCPWALDCSLPSCHVRDKQSTAEMHVRTAIQHGRSGGTGLLPDLAAAPLGQERPVPPALPCWIAYILIRTRYSPLLSGR